MDQSKIVQVGNRVSVLFVTIPERYDEDEEDLYERDFAEALGEDLVDACIVDGFDTPHEEECEHYVGWMDAYLEAIPARCTHTSADTPGHDACVQIARLAQGLRDGLQLHASFFLMPEEELRVAIDARTIALARVLGASGARYIPPARWVGAECEAVNFDEYLEYARLHIMLGDSTPSARQAGSPIDEEAHLSYVAYLKEELEEMGVRFFQNLAHMRAMRRVLSVSFEDTDAEPLPEARSRPCAAPPLRDSAVSQ